MIAGKDARETSCLCQQNCSDFASKLPRFCQQTAAILPANCRDFASKLSHPGQQGAASWTAMFSVEGLNYNKRSITGGSAGATGWRCRRYLVEVPALRGGGAGGTK